MKEILQKLENIDSIDIEEVVKDFLLYYRTNGRHKYHEVTTYIINKFKVIEELETVNIILSNLDLVMKRVEVLCNCTAAGVDMYCCNKDTPPAFSCSVDNGSCFEYKQLYKKLEKLHDHLSLEFARISDIRIESSRIETLFEEVKDKEIDLGKRIESLKQEEEILHESVVSASEKATGMQKDYITILGIFASIVLAFTGGIAFSTSVLENINAISPYRLAMVCIGLAFVLINIIYILVRFVQEINKSKGEKIKYPVFMYVINGILVLAFVMTASVWYFCSFKGN